MDDKLEIKLFYDILIIKKLLIKYNLISYNEYSDAFKEEVENSNLADNIKKQILKDFEGGA